MLQQFQVRLLLLMLVELRKVMREINTIDKPNNVKFNVGGATDDINTAMSQLAFAMLIAIVIVYLVLVITFKGGLAPFTILFSLPFTAIGIVFALLITEKPFQYQV